MMKTILTAVCSAAVTSSVALGAFSLGARNNKEPIDPDDWMVPELVVSDAAFGKEPLVQYSRTAKKTFPVSWTVEVNTEDGEPVCSNSSQNLIEDGFQSWRDKPLFSWWMRVEDPRRECERAPEWPLRPGCYSVETTYHTTAPDGRSVIIPVPAATFCVAKEGEEPLVPSTTTAPEDAPDLPE